MIQMMDLTKTEQDYLKIIYAIQNEQPDKLVSLKELGERLEVTGATVTEAVKRLEKKALVEYQSYKGVRLTSKGREEARFIMKSHRIWELFLLENLGYQESEVHDEAEKLEHAASPMLIERLYEFLGSPKTCPHGTEIPMEVFWYEEKVQKNVSELDEGLRAHIISIPQETADYLSKIGVAANPTYIKLLERLTDNSILVEIDLKGPIVLPVAFQKDMMVELYSKK